MTTAFCRELLGKNYLGHCEDSGRGVSSTQQQEGLTSSMACSWSSCCCRISRCRCSSSSCRRMYSCQSKCRAVGRQESREKTPCQNSRLRGEFPPPRTCSRSARLFSSSARRRSSSSLRRRSISSTRLFSSCSRRRCSRSCCLRISRSRRCCCSVWAQKARSQPRRRGGEDKVLAKPP